MNFEEARDMAMLYAISPELTCACDEVHICQQCVEEHDGSDYREQLKQLTKALAEKSNNNK